MQQRRHVRRVDHQIDDVENSENWLVFHHFQEAIPEPPKHTGRFNPMATRRLLHLFQSTTGTPSIVPVKTVSRWQAAASDAREAFDRMRDAQDELHTALADLDEIKGNKSLPDSRVGETLAECWWTGCVCSQSKRLAALADLTEYEEAVFAAEHTNLPIGFGRD